ncbi:Crp/Fnr family transcriptional regulator [Ideonella sp. A 288]|uniref:Crp/Fnr family transcriptional regulator n=1 Tax=Ideonella sp. A 288 TaxID=1962181 RepID=UPI0013038BCE|nr:cyclic nucleotide-binding domain-containing protein [Ideonella sp. A 288]
MPETTLSSALSLGAAVPASGAGQPTTSIDILRLMGVVPQDTWAAEQVPAPLRRLRAGDTLFLEGARADLIYIVRAGTFKTTCTAEDGYEQVLGFAGRREVLGFDAICMGQHPTSAMALEPSSVYGLAVRDVFAAGQRVPELDRMLHLAASQGLRHRGQLVDVMAAVAAEVRLARFLVHWSQRMAAVGESPRHFHLRMARRDIASHLGVAHETVSRSFGALAAWGFLRVANRDIEILRMEELVTFSRNTRRPSKEVGTFAHSHVPAAHDNVTVLRRPTELERAPGQRVASH